MTEDSIREFVEGNFVDVDIAIAKDGDGSPQVAWGDTFFIHREDKRRFPFATIVTKDYGDFDAASNLNREGVFRLNIGLSKETYQRLFPDDRTYDFTALDVLIPHPVYGRNHWVSVLNPSDATFRSLEPLFTEAYEIAVNRARPRGPRAPGARKSSRSRSSPR